MQNSKQIKKNRNIKTACTLKNSRSELCIKPYLGKGTG
jgi:hypothetical protein